MKQLIKYPAIFCTIILVIITPVLSMAQPAGPGGDPFVAPVNGGVAFVAVLAFLYGAYRIYQLAKKSRAGNTDR